jgi:hypothetical protein
VLPEAVDHELTEQQRLFQTDDFSEGILAMDERRPPNFKGQ